MVVVPVVTFVVVAVDTFVAIAEIVATVRFVVAAAMRLY